MLFSKRLSHGDNYPTDYYGEGYKPKTKWSDWNGFNNIIIKFSGDQK